MAQLVEHHLAKVRVAGSSPVFRSISLPYATGGPSSPPCGHARLFIHGSAIVNVKGWMKGRVEYVPGPISQPVYSRAHNEAGGVADAASVGEAAASVGPIVAGLVVATLPGETTGDAAGAHADAIKSVATAATIAWGLMKLPPTQAPHRHR